ncbi:hypothetical protein G647_06800 [Cladophialophora carrionii CBS 160.54]|uniref:Uncharacterized protein n=1 Tax=Cladophialophora carrionii CBS 160.54 TaxID=1279043 RepID=V9D720_9EURO|nr:uncharacterized protein G647_06800 [Cladophialophora carrionii CBS 160.54]ETI22724.1 hypothetical protein G647_06800 [Cladophialophora carrionii CBS 160.54]
MVPRTALQMRLPIQGLKPAARSNHFLRTQRLQLQSRRTYAEKAAPVRSDQPRDWTSRLPLILLAGVAAYLPFYYLSHTDKPGASENAKMTEARRQGNPANERRDPRDSSVKTIEQKRERDGVDHRSEERKRAEG